MTQEEFAEKIGVEQATISRNELGKNLLSLS
ncbi:MAG: helix-turn-helix domain-containing protein [Clostridium sp.]